MASTMNSGDTRLGRTMNKKWQTSWMYVFLSLYLTLSVVSGSSVMTDFVAVQEQPFSSSNDRRIRPILAVRGSFAGERSSHLLVLSYVTRSSPPHM